MTKKILVLALALTAAGALSAKKYPHPESGVSVDIPNNWKVSGDANSLNAETKDGEAALFFQVMGADNVDAALAALDGELAKVVQDLKHGEGKNVKMNGMQGKSVEGTGTVSGKPVEVGVIVLKTPKDKVLLVFGIVSKAAVKKHQRALTGILKSIKKSK